MRDNRDNFDVEAFYAALDSQRTALNMTWKDVAAEASVSASTLTRMSDGKRPDVDGLAALLRWSGLRAETFIRKTENQGKPETLAQVSAVLRADRTLSKESAAALDQIFRAAYRRFQEPEKK
jgi:transcriptional regulator with XRE-family HTH domain